MYPAEFGYLRAGSVAEALAVLAEGGGDEEIKVLAGGQSLLPMMKLRLATPATLLDIGALAELAHTELAHTELAHTELAMTESGRIGALATYRSLEQDPVVRERFPALADALRVLADPQVRARGTVGGAVAHADPAADLPAVLLALDAEVTMARAGGSRTVPLDGFVHGAYETDVREDELITGIVLPPAGPGQAYEKFEQPASHLPLAGVCAAVELRDGVLARPRIAVTGVAGRVFRAREAEAFLTGQEPAEAILAEAATRIRADAPRPLDDIHASGPFRLRLAEVLARRALARAIARDTSSRTGAVPR